ncbi:MAG: hypothetical protein JWR20_2471 [Marmoricola sp.]|nr:hypothetical protein [Marmoricola sp.]
MKADAREASLDRREQALTVRLSRANDIAAAAAKRDAVTDARDLRADNRDEALERARSSREGFTYDPKAAGRHAAADDRHHSKGDREAAGKDRAAITGDPEQAETN